MDEIDSDAALVLPRGRWTPIAFRPRSALGPSALTWIQIEGAPLDQATAAPAAHCRHDCHGQPAHAAVCGVGRATGGHVERSCSEPLSTGASAIHGAICWVPKPHGPQICGNVGLM